jgi:beta-lactamase class A
MKHFILIVCLITSIGCTDKSGVKYDEFRALIINEISNIDGDIAVAYINLDNPSDTLFINADEMFHAASTMKTPVMIEVYKQANEGLFTLTDSLAIHNEFKSIVDGSSYSMDITRDWGDGLYDKIGQNMSIFDIVYEMVIHSGNLATNIIIDLVDAKKVTATMRELGASQIEVLRGVEDMLAFQAGLSNRTSARDLAIIFKHIANGTAVSAQASEEMIKILRDQQFREMIPAGLPEDAIVAHKTGSITGVNHDSGIIYLANGQSYVLVILSKNLSQNSDGTEVGAKISSLVYNWVTE